MDNKKIKILFAINVLNFGGAPAVVYNQAKYLDKDNFDVYIMVLYPTNKAGYLSQLNFLKYNQIFQFDLKNRHPLDFKTWLKIYKMLRREKFDVVYTHLFLTNLIVRPLAWLAAIPVILSFEHSNYTNKKYWQIIIDKILSAITDKIIVSTKAVVEFTSKQEMINRNKFKIIANPVILPEKNSINKAGLKNELGLPADSFVVLTLGRFSEEKGLTYFLEMAEQAIKQNEKIYFLLVGYGHLAEKLRAEIESRGLIGRCQLVIQPERAKEFYYIGDVFVLPSLREGQSIATYEALKVGLPVIASSLDTIKDIIKDGVNGLLVKPGDSHAIYKKIMLLFNNLELREKLSQNGRLSVANFTMEKNIEQLTELIFKLLKIK